MASSAQTPSSDAEDLGVSAREFLTYCAAERERKLNSGEDFDEQAFDEAVELVLRKLRVLAEEGWT
jgi:hypothetical protein